MDNHGDTARWWVYRKSKQFFPIWEGILLPFCPYRGPFLPFGGISATLFSMWRVLLSLWRAFIGLAPLAKISAGAHGWVAFAHKERVRSVKRKFIGLRLN